MRHPIWELFACAIAMAIGSAAIADETPAMTLVTVKSLAASTVTATGRVQALVAAKISPRVSGHLVAMGADASGHALDAGMSVRKGDLLFQLDETTFKNGEALAAATLASAQAALENLKAPTRPERMEQFKNAVVELESRLAERKSDEQRYARLVEEKTAPAKRLEEARTELAVTEARLNAAKARLAEAMNGPTRTEIAMAEARVKEAAAALRIAQDDLRDAKVRAPFDGLITRRTKSVGDYIAANPPVDVLDMIAVDALETEIRVPESYKARVRAGETKVKITGSTVKTPIESVVTRVVEEIDPAHGTFVCRIAIPAGSQLTPGAFVTADLALDADQSRVIVPARALTTEAGKTYVFVAKEGKARRREVAVSERLTEDVVIRSGVAVGEQVILAPVESLKDGMAAGEK